MRLADLAGKTVVVWGAGREATAVIHAIRNAGVDCRLQVVDEAPDGNETLEDIDIVRGADGVDTLLAADVIVRSPGVSPNRPDVMRVLAAVPAHTTATKLWFAEPHAPVIAVTGTKGKSTTASLIAHLLHGVGVDARLAGNIGRSPLDHHGEDEPDRWVLELSSYQTSDLDRSPDVGVLTSLSPEHLDWHGSYDNYVSDKLNLFAHDSGAVVVNMADAGAAEMTGRLGNVIAANTSEGVHVAGDRFVSGGDDLFGVDVLRLLGTHNRQLVAVALAALAASGVDLVVERQRLATALGGFAPLEHRLQPVSDAKGLTWIDDGLSTTPVATMAALDAFGDRHSTVLVGGHDRGLDYKAFAEYVAANEHRLTVITMPDSGERIASAIGQRRLDDDRYLVHCTDGLEEAVAVAARVTPAGGVVLLSPAAPSFGRFNSYVERSRAFVDAVDQLV